MNWKIFIGLLGMELAISPLSAQTVDVHSLISATGIASHEVYYSGNDKTKLHAADWQGKQSVTSLLRPCRQSKHWRAEIIAHHYVARTYSIWFRLSVSPRSWRRHLLQTRHLQDSQICYSGRMPRNYSSRMQFLTILWRSDAFLLLKHTTEVLRVFKSQTIGHLRYGLAWRKFIFRQLNNKPAYAVACRISGGFLYDIPEVVGRHT